MASREHKIVRRAEAMARLGFLSKLLAEHLKVEVIDIATTNRDNELAEIQRIENINGLLTQLLEAVNTTQVDDSAKKPAVKSKHGAH